jgi:hypothetical protein
MSAAVPMLGTQGGFGQSLPIPLPGPLGDVIAHPSQWLVDTFNAALATVGRQTVADALDFMNWVLGNSNVVTQTPPVLTYESSVVTGLLEDVARIANAGLAAVAAWSGISAIIRPHLRAPYHGALEILPRIVLSAVLVNTTLLWSRFAIDLNNALCNELGLAHIQPLSVAATQPEGTNVLLNLVTVGIYLIMGLLLFTQMLMRLALLDALLIIGPLAALCWALPQTYGWARLWFSTFFATVFVQFIQVLVLRLGSDLMTNLPVVFGSGANPVSAGQLWLVTLLLGVAVLQLARKIPRLMPGYASGAVLMHDSPMTLIRGVQQLMHPRGGNSSGNSAGNRR